MGSPKCRRRSLSILRAEAFPMCTAPSRTKRPSSSACPTRRRTCQTTSSKRCSEWTKRRFTSCARGNRRISRERRDCFESTGCICYSRVYVFVWEQILCVCAGSLLRAFLCLFYIAFGYLLSQQIVQNKILF